MMEYGNVEMMSQKDVERLHSLIRAADSINAGLMDEVTVEPEDGDTVIFGHTVSDLQEDVEVQGDSIVGTLKYTSTGSLPDYWGAGYFLVLKFSDPDATATSVKVGLAPSVSSGLVELDEDMNAVFRVASTEQVIEVKAYIGAELVDTRTLRLTGLTLETDED